MVDLCFFGLVLSIGMVLNHLWVFGEVESNEDTFGLRFISKSGEATEELWRKVEERFNVLAKDGLLAREDFGECIGEEI